MIWCFVVVDREAAKLDSISRKLAQLKASDPSLRIFGARAHRYQLGPTLTEDRLSRLERDFGASLPEGYRAFLIALGNGGAGPFYGLFPLAGNDPEDITSFDSIGKPFPWKNKLLRPRIDLPGVVYICTYGCALRFFLVVTGQCRGEVWHDWRADHLGIYPATNEGGERLHFLDWYDQWLDKSLSTLKP